MRTWNGVVVGRTESKQMEEQSMAQDPIIGEIRAIRDEFAKEHGYDVKAIVAALQREEAESGRKVISLPPKQLLKKQRARKTG